MILSFYPKSKRRLFFSSWKYLLSVRPGQLRSWTRTLGRSLSTHHTTSQNMYISRSRYHMIFMVGEKLSLVAFGQNIPTFVPAALAAMKVLVIAAFKSSCIVPSRSGWAMLLTRSKGHTKGTSITGTAAVASTFSSEEWSHLPVGDTQRLPSMDRNVIVEKDYRIQERHVEGTLL